MDGGGEEEAMPRSSSPPNPFDESDDEEVEREEDAKTPAKLTINGDLPSTPLRHNDVASRPVPAPRRVAEPTPPPRPAPRVRLPRAADGLPVGACSLREYRNDCFMKRERIRRCSSSRLS